MRRGQFKTKIQNELSRLKSEQIITFARHCAIIGLPFIGSNGHFIFWKNEERQRYLYNIFYAIDFAYIAAGTDGGAARAAIAAATEAATAADISAADSYAKAETYSVVTYAAGVNAKPASIDAVDTAAAAVDDAADADDAAAAAVTVAIADGDAADAASNAANAVATAVNTSVAVNDIYATNAAIEAAVAVVDAATVSNRYNLKKIFQQRIIEDLEKIKKNEHPIVSIKEYGEIWTNFQLALKNEGCEYWGEFYQNIFDNDLKIDKEALSRRVNVPKEIREKGAIAVANFLISLEKGATRLNEARVIILGDKGVGKTCIARKLVNPKAEMTTDEESTAGVDLHQWSIDGDEAIKVNIWDFAGHTVTHAVHQFFLSERCLYIMVYDGRTEERNRLVYWLNHMKNFGGDSKAIILVNKRDKHSVQIPINNLKEAFPILGIYNFSIKEDTKDLEKFRSDIADYIKNNPSWKKQDIPLNYYEVKEELENYFNNASKEDCLEHISKKEFDSIAQKHEVENSEQLLKDLHSLGISLWYQEMEKYDTLVLNPEWISQGVYKIINWVYNAKKHSLTLKDFEQVFEEDKKRYPDKKNHEFLFDLMKHYELAYQAKKQKNLIIPHLMKEDRPVNLPNFKIEDSLRIQYKAEQPLPPNTISRFIVRHHHQIKSNAEVWRHGVVLKDGKGSIALVREDDRTISVSAKGKNKSNFIDELRGTLNDIFNSYKSDKPELHYRIQRFGEIIINHKKENELWLPEGKIINHHTLNKPYLDDETNSLIPMNAVVKTYQIESNYPTSSNRIKLERDEYLKLKKIWIKKLKKADLDGVINQLEKYIEERNDSYSENEFIQLTSRFNRAERNFGKGIIDINQYNLEMNQINAAILKFINNLE